MHVIEEEIVRASPDELRAYVAGATGDATRSRIHRTVRFGQADRGWLEVLRHALERLGSRGWIYREGASRSFWVLETTASIDFFLDPRTLTANGERLAYVRGFFDAEGGMPRRAESRLYLQLAQRDAERIAAIRCVLVDMGLECGVVHNPSSRVDPEYWRFYVRAMSHRRFLMEVGSWHPRKRAQMDARLGGGERARRETPRPFGVYAPS